MLSQPDLTQRNILQGKRTFGVESESKAIARELDRQSLQEFNEDLRYN